MTKTRTVIVGGDTSGAVAAAERMADAFDAATDRIRRDAARTKVEIPVTVDDAQARRALDRIPAAARDAGRRAGVGLRGEMGSALSGLLGQAGPLGSALDGVVGSFDSLSRGTAAALGVLAVGGVIAQKSVGSYLQLAQGVRTLSVATGASAEDSSRLISVFDDTGASVEDVTKALTNLTKNANSKPFAALGLDAKQASDGTLDLIGTLDNVIVQLEGTEDQAKKTDILLASFGKGYEAILPGLVKGSAQFRAALDGVSEAQILGDDAVEDAEAWQSSIDNLKDSVGDLGLQIGKVLTPEVIEFTDNATTAVGVVIDLKNQIQGLADDIPGGGRFGDALGDVFKITTNPLAAFGEVKDRFAAVADEFGVGIDLITDANQSLISGARLASAAIETEGEALVRAQEQAKEFAKAAEDAAKADADRLAAGLSLADAREKATASLRALTGEEERAAAAAKQVEQAERARADTLRRGEAVERARGQLADVRIRNASALERAEAAVAEAATRGAERVTAAEGRIKEAFDKVEEATGRVQDAEGDLASARDAAEAAADGMAEAQERVRRVLEGVGAEAVEAKDALRDLQAAQDEAASAELAVRGSERRLVEAEEKRAIALDPAALQRERDRLALELEEARAAVRRAEERARKTASDPNASADDRQDATRDAARTRLSSADRIEELERKLRDLADTSDEAAEADDEVKKAQLEVAASRRRVTDETAAAAEAQRKYTGTVEGFAGTSKEGIEAQEGLTEAVQGTLRADDEVVKKQGAVTSAVTERDRALAAVAAAQKGRDDERIASVLAVKAKEKELSDARAAAAQAEREAVKKINEESRPAFRELAVDIGKARDSSGGLEKKITDAITAQKNLIIQAAATKGVAVTEADAIRDAWEEVRAKIKEAGDQKLIFAGEKVATDAGLPGGTLPPALTRTTTPRTGATLPSADLTRETTPRTGATIPTPAERAAAAGPVPVVVVGGTGFDRAQPARLPAPSSGVVLASGVLAGSGIGVQTGTTIVLNLAPGAIVTQAKDGESLLKEISAFATRVGRVTRDGAIKARP